jgi:hypothetical protein
MEPQSYARQMQEEMIRKIESARPRYVIFVGLPTSWLRRAESKSLLLTWADQYIQTYYGVVGLVNIVSSDRTDYYFEKMPESTATAWRLRADLPTKVITLPATSNRPLPALCSRAHRVPNFPT